MRNPPEEALRPALLKPREAAEYLSLCERTLWSLKCSGDIPHIRIGRSVRYSIDDLDSYIDAQRIGPSSV